MWTYGEMSVVNNCGNQGDNDRDTKSDDLGGRFWHLADILFAELDVS